MLLYNRYLLMHMIVIHSKHYLSLLKENNSSIINFIGQHYVTKLNVGVDNRLILSSENSSYPLQLTLFTVSYFSSYSETRIIFIRFKSGLHIIQKNLFLSFSQQSISSVERLSSLLTHSFLLLELFLHSASFFYACQSFMFDLFHGISKIENCRLLYDEIVNSLCCPPLSPQGFH